MKPIAKILATLGLSLVALSSSAAPRFLITHNNTDAESNAFIDGVIPSQHPSKPHSENRVFWTAVRLACFGHIVEDYCAAVIKMETDTPNPLVIGTLKMNMHTGEIIPAQLSANGYTVTVNGPGESTITKD